MFKYFRTEHTVEMTVRKRDLLPVVEHLDMFLTMVVRFVLYVQPDVLIDPERSWYGLLPAAKIE